MAKLAVTSVTATQRPRATESLQFYPNPSNGGTVKTRWKVIEVTSQILVHDALGRCVLAYVLPAGRSEAVLLGASLKRGMYTLRLQTATSVATGLLVTE